MKHSAHSEESILRKIRKIAGSSKGAGKHRTTLGIGDDAALLEPKKDHEIILTCDWFLEGSHFLRRKHPPDSVGWKCLARALSDVGAMGGKPVCFLLSLALPQELTGKWLDAFLGGLHRASLHWDCPLTGGDTTKSQRVLINVSVIGEIRRGHAKLRSGAKPGDFIYASGVLGEAEAGLQILKGTSGNIKIKSGDKRLRKHLYPEPRIALGQWLAEKNIASAMMDISDGLSTDLTRLCEASKVGARVNASRLPINQISHLSSSLSTALHGGDDYELLFTVPKTHVSKLPSSYRGVQLTQIGEITANKRLLLIGNDKKAELLIQGGWDPFR